MADEFDRIIDLLAAAPGGDRTGVAEGVRRLDPDDRREFALRLSQDRLPFQRERGVTGIIDVAVPVGETLLAFVLVPPGNAIAPADIGPRLSLQFWLHMLPRVIVVVLGLDESLAPFRASASEHEGRPDAVLRRVRLDRSKADGEPGEGAPSRLGRVLRPRWFGFRRH